MSQVSPGAGITLGGVWEYCLTSIRRTFADHIALYVCSILFCGLTLATSLYWHFDLPISASFAFIENLIPFVVLIVGMAAGVQLVLMIRHGEEGSAFRAMGRWLYAKALAEDRPGNVFHTIMTFSPLMIAFCALKDQIPKIDPFSWDHLFMQWDRVIGFGELPWQRLQPILGHPPITATINFAYDFWFVVMFAVLMWQAFARRGSVLRMQFLLAFAFAWFIAGNVLATVFSSAGPCFYGHFFSHDPYAAQMHYLRGVAQTWPVWSINVQDMLWQSYATSRGAISGISAMPSMHVTVATLIACVCWRADRRLGAALWTFAAVIVIGSVHLAWHYAVDSIAALALAIAFWKVAGWIATAQARRQTLAQPRGEPALACATSPRADW